MLKRADYLVVACPLTEEARGLLGTRELSSMKSEAVLVNVARGEIVDEEALAYVLQQGVIRGAALDVFSEEPFPDDSPLWNLSNVVMTPHMRVRRPPNRSASPRSSRRTSPPTRTTSPTRS